MRVFKRWFTRKWVELLHPNLVRSYYLTFSSMDGQQVLQHLLDHVYCTVYYGTDPNEALAHNARRSVVQEILENIDAGEHPSKYQKDVQPQEILNAP